MPRHTPALDRLRVSTPCREDWERMTGNDQVRFCSHCASHVHNLSAMTRKQARRLVAESNGRLCIRYLSRPDGSTSAAAPPALLQISRRASRLAAGAFTAALSLTANVGAQTPAAPQEQSAAESHSGQTLPIVESPGKSLSGAVVDQAGALVPGAKVTLSHAVTNFKRMVETNDDGAYAFEDVPAGEGYSLGITALGFKSLIVQDVVLTRSGTRLSDMTLEVAGELVTMGIVAITEPTDPLVKAVQAGDARRVRKLLAGGADVNVRDKAIDVTPLMEAVERADAEMLRLLMREGADVNRRNNAGQTALMRLDEDATPELVRMLLDAGARHDIADDDGRTALMAAALADNARAIDILLDAGAEIDRADESGMTALMIAAAEDSGDAVKRLLARGADVNRQDENEATALKHALDNEHAGIAGLLRRRGAVEPPKDEEQSAGAEAGSDEPGKVR